MSALGEGPVGFLEWLLRASWQAGLLAVLILAARQVFFRRLPPKWHYRLWLLLVVRLLLPEWPQTTFSIFNWIEINGPLRAAERMQDSRVTLAPRASTAPTHAEVASRIDVPAEGNAGESMERPRPTASVPGRGSVPATGGSTPGAVDVERGMSGWWMAWWLWAVGTLGVAGRLVWKDCRLRVSLRHHIPIAVGEVVDLVEECRRALALRRRVDVVETEEVASPAIHGVWRPRLLVPDGTFERFSRSELRHIFLHELAHLKRRDLEVNWLTSLLLALHWFNPVLWWAFRRMRSDRELATDALVLGHLRGEDPAAYGETILRVLEQAPQMEAATGLVGIAEDRLQIEQRIRAIAGHGRTRRLSWLGAPLLVTLGALALTDAQSPTPPPPSRLPTGSADDTRAGASPEATLQGTSVANRSREVEIRVVAVEGNGVVPGAMVVLERAFYSRPVEVIRKAADEHGVVRVEFVPDETSRMTLWVEAPGYLSCSTEWLKHQVAAIPAGVVAKVSRGVELGGRVTDTNGNPIEGAEVMHGGGFRLYLGEGEPGAASLWSPRAGTLIATTDAEGRWKTRSLWPGVTIADFRVGKAGYAGTLYSTQTTEAQEVAGPGRRVALDDLKGGRARFVLETGQTLRGRIQDSDNLPVAGATVRYSERWEEMTYWSDPVGSGVAQSDAGGEFVIADLPRTRVHLAIQAPGFAPSVAEFDLRNPPAVAEMRLQPATVLSGTLQARDGRKLAGVRIQVQDLSAWPGVRWESVSGPEGDFRWDGAPEETIRMRFELEGFIPVNRSLKAGEPHVIRLDENLRLAGRVVDAVEGRPVTNFRIYWADRAEYLPFRRKFPIRGQDGTYLLDLGALHEETWSEGYAHQFVFRIEAEGYEPQTSRVFSSRTGDVGWVTHDLRLKPVDRLRVRVVDPDGKVVDGAQVALVSPNGRIRLAGRPQFEDIDGTDFPRTGLDGGSLITPDPEATEIIAVHERGVGWEKISKVQAAGDSTLRLRRWARVEGSVGHASAPITNALVHLTSRLLSVSPVSMGMIHMTSTSGPDGRFVFEHVPPAECFVYRMLPTERGSASGPQEKLLLEPGMTASVRMGGRGRPVVGRMQIRNPYVRVDWQQEQYWVHPARTQKPAQVGLLERIRRAWEGEERPGTSTTVANHPMRFAGDGSFQIDEVEPGSYEFAIRLLDPRDPDAFAFGRSIGQFHGKFDVPGGPDRDSDVPFDIGVLEMDLKPEVKLGETLAPDFSVPGLDGREVGLADFRGKFVLLDFWATWCGPCLADLPHLRQVYAKFGKREDFQMLSLSLDASMEVARSYVERNNMPWRHAHLGDSSASTVPSAYGVVGIPALFLINPEGKIIAKDLKGVALEAELGKWLR